jgi:hypothetical protein
MLLGRMARKLLAGALVAAGTVSSVARHIGWWVGHQVDGRTHDARPAEAEER